MSKTKWSPSQKRIFETAQLSWMIDHTSDKVLDSMQKAQLKKAVARHFAVCPHLADSNQKTFCARCPAHCFTPGQAAQIRQVMKSAGWKFMLCHPIKAWQHVLVDTGRL